MQDHLKLDPMVKQHMTDVSTYQGELLDTEAPWDSNQQLVAGRKWLLDRDQPGRRTSPTETVSSWVTQDLVVSSAK